MGLRVVLVAFITFGLITLSVAGNAQQGVTMHTERTWALSPLSQLLVVSDQDLYGQPGQAPLADYLKTALALNFARTEAVSDIAAGGLIQGMAIARARGFQFVLQPILLVHGSVAGASTRELSTHLDTAGLSSASTLDQRPPELIPTTPRSPAAVVNTEVPAVVVNRPLTLAQKPKSIQLKVILYDAQSGRMLDNTLVTSVNRWYDFTPSDLAGLVAKACDAYARSLSSLQREP